MDVGANRGDAVANGLLMGFDKVVAIEPAHKVYRELVIRYLHDPQVIPLKLALSDTCDERVEFYECVEDGLSTIEKKWLTDPAMPYNGKEFRTVQATTCTLDHIIDLYGNPELVKIDVEGAESKVLAGLTKKPEKLCLEWTIQTLDEHVEQLRRLRDVNGYTEYAPQYITDYLIEPEGYLPLVPEDFPRWIEDTKDQWQSSGWVEAGGFRPTADVGMLWVR